MLRALTTQLIREGRVTTTKARAKALRDEAERMITLAKDGSLASRRRAMGYIYDKQLVHALFGVTAMSKAIERSALWKDHRKNFWMDWRRHSRLSLLEPMVLMSLSRSTRCTTAEHRFSLAWVGILSRLRQILITPPVPWKTVS